MFDRVLPETIKPAKLARQGASLVGVIPLERLSHLARDLPEGAGEQTVTLNIRFEPGAGGVPLVTGQVSATVPMQCQRCLERVDITLDAPVKLAIIGPDAEQESLPEGFEPLDVDGEEVSLADMIEQELILVMPIVPQHESCVNPHAPQQETEIAAVQQETPTQNPFKDLASLIKQDKSGDL